MEKTVDKNNPIGSGPNSPGKIDPVKEFKLRRLIEIQKELDLRKALFTEYDLIVMDLAKEGFSNAEIEGLVLTLEDKFATGNTGWTSAAVKRYEMKIEPREKVEKRMKKRGAV